MVPFAFEKWASLPKTSSGKVDRVLLAEKSAVEAGLRKAG
jgi:acyl-coenzyme A synthetase/AMP-(fatty) acid ligase